MEKFVIGGSVLLGTSIVATAWWLSSTAIEPVVATPAAALPSARAAPAAPVPAPAVPSAPGATLAEQVDALVASRDPRQAFAAYRLLADCATFNQNGDRLIFEPDATPHSDNDGVLPGFRTLSEPEKRHEAALCASMTERMRQSRLDYLERAAQAGIPGAAMAQVNEGPFGDRTALTTRPDDPLVKEWKARVQERLARIADEQADVGVLSYLSAMRTVGSDVFDKDPAQAFRYGVATSLIMQELAGPDNDLARLYRADGGLMQNAAASLTAPERSAQLVEAQRIAGVARARRLQSAPQP